MKKLLIFINFSDMKKRISNQHPNSQKGFFLIKRGHVQLITGLFLAFLLVLTTENLKGQQIQELSRKLGVMKASTDPSVRAEGIRLESLVYDVLPSLFFEDGQLEIVPGVYPIRVNTDVSSLQLVLNSRYNQVEILLIKIQSLQDLQMSLNLADLSGYSKVKYIFLLFTFEICPEIIVEGTCEIKKVSNMVHIGDNARISVIYSISIPS